MKASNTRRTVAVPIAILAGLALAAPAAANPIVSMPTVTGEPVVGASLQASAVLMSGKGTIGYQWLRCSASGTAACEPIAGATGTSYLIVLADAGLRLAVRAQATNPKGETGPSVRSALIGPVLVPAPVPTPTPTPEPSPEPSAEPSPDPASSPEPGDGDPTPTTWETAGPAQDAGPAAPVGGAALGGARLLDPFPVVRIKGALIRDGARVTLFSVRAPFGSTVDLRCTGRRCPHRRWATSVGRVRRLERYLPAGTKIVVRVSRIGRIGKYARIVIRDGKAPARRDACLLPGRTAPSACPAP